MKCKWDKCTNEARDKSPFCGGTCKKRYQRASGTATHQRSSGQVYLVHCVGFPYYKIGITTAITPLDRVKALQTGMPFELELVAAIPVKDAGTAERYLHDTYKEYRVRGEWFDFTDDMLTEVLAKYDHIKLFYKMTA